MTKVKEFCLFYFYKKDGLPGRSQRRSLERSDTTTLGILVTLAHFSHYLRFTQAKPVITDHVRKFCCFKNLNQLSSNLLNCPVSRSTWTMVFLKRLPRLRIILRTSIVWSVEIKDGAIAGTPSIASGLFLLFLSS